MGRAAVIAAVLLVCAADARADMFDDAIAGFEGVVDHCQEGLDLADELLADDGRAEDELAEVAKDRSMVELMCSMIRDDIDSLVDMVASYRACSDDCDEQLALVGFTVEKAQAEINRMSEDMNELYSIAAGEGFTPDEERPYVPLPTVDPGAFEDDAPHAIALATLGVSIDVPGSWDVSAGDGADLISQDGVTVAAVMSQSAYDCATAVDGVSGAYDDHRDVTISIPYAWSGVEYAVDGQDGGLYCREHGGASVIVSAPASIASVLIPSIEAALSPPSVDDAGGSGGGSEPSPTPETPHRRSLIGGLFPRTLQLGLVRRADEMGSGFGFGLQVGRLSWRENHRFTIGYELAGAAASGFWDLSAQVRGGLSPMLSDLPVDAYVLGGVEAIGGAHQMETDVAPVLGAGAEVLFTLPGLGADLAANVMADPDGFHAYTLHGGLLFGAEEGRVRLGTSYVRYADDTSVLWFTLGGTVLEMK